MQTPTWKRAAGGLLVVSLSLSLVLNTLPEQPYQWMLVGGGLGLATSLAFPRINRHLPRFQQLALAVTGIGGFWSIIAESGGPIEITSSLLAGGTLAFVVIAIGHRFTANRKHPSTKQN